MTLMLITRNSLGTSYTFSDKLVVHREIWIRIMILSPQQIWLTFDLPGRLTPCSVGVREVLFQSDASDPTSATGKERHSFRMNVSNRTPLHFVYMRYFL